MDNTYTPEDWRRLGKTLQERRGHLGYGYRQRRKFLADRGGDSPPSDKMLDRLERGERQAYPPETIAYLESLYGYRRGSFEAILRGGEPEPDGDGDVSPGSETDRAFINAVRLLAAQDHKDPAVILREIRALVCRWPGGDAEESPGVRESA
jgi:hypothetical protein